MSHLLAEDDRHSLAYMYAEIGAVPLNMEKRVRDYVGKRGPRFTFDKQIYKSRFELERKNGWVKNFRALRLRRSAHPATFKAMVYLALIIILLRRS